jgi:hypothetical protein
MRIRYANGTTREGLLLSKGDGMLRVAVKGVNDALVLHSVSGAWMAESREPVQIELEWQRIPSRAVPDRTDCIFEQDMAERLIRVVQAHETPPKRHAARCD